MKTIWFVYPYGLIPGENTQEIRYLRFGRELSKNYNCVWWTSNYSRRLNKIRSEEAISVQDNLKIMLVPTTPYHKSISFRRVLFELNFTWNLKKLWKTVEKPNLIITPATGMITAFRPVWPYIRDKDVKAVFDLMDVHPINSFMKEHHPFLYPVFKVFDWVIFSMIRAHETRSSSTFVLVISQHVGMLQAHWNRVSGIFYKL